MTDGANIVIASIVSFSTPLPYECTIGCPMWWDRWFTSRVLLRERYLVCTLVVQVYAATMHYCGNILHAPYVFMVYEENRTMQQRLVCPSCGHSSCGHLRRL